MPGVLLREGRKMAARAFEGAVYDAADEFAIILFTNDATVTVDSEPGDFTQATFTGYVPISREFGETTGPVSDGDDEVVLLGGDSFIWDCTAAPQTIRGWVAVNLGNDEIFAAEKYDVPHVLEVGSRHTLFASIRVGACG